MLKKTNREENNKSNQIFEANEDPFIENLSFIKERKIFVKRKNEGIRSSNLDLLGS